MSISVDIYRARIGLFSSNMVLRQRRHKTKRDLRLCHSGNQFAMDLYVKTKVNQINELFSETGVKIKEEKTSEGFASTGIYHKTKKDEEIRFILTLFMPRNGSCYPFLLKTACLTLSLCFW